MKRFEPANDFINFHCVRITPSKIIFQETGLKQNYQAKISLQNVGKSKVTVRILQPKSKVFHIDCIMKGIDLSPGLKLVKTIKAKTIPNTPKECLIPIYVNDHRYDYLVLLSSPVNTIRITPTNLDFGLLNAGTLHVSQTITIENDSEKESSFYIDLKKCGDNVIVETTRGRIKPKDSYQVTVRVVTLNKINIDCVIFVKCAYQITPVTITAKVIIPRMEVIHPNATENFTCLEFPPTYYGLTSSLNLFIRNYSAIGYMFATFGEIDNRYLELDDARYKSLDFKFFKMKPSDGVFQNDETRLFKFTFCPVEVDKTIKNIPYFFCKFIMHRFYCDHYNKKNIQADVNENSSTTNLRSLETKSSSNLYIREASSLHVFSKDKSNLYFINQVENSFTRIYLYGTAELPSIQIIPDEISIGNMRLNSRETRVIELKNNSKVLPIIFRYKKTPHIYLESEFFYLTPLQSTQISVHVEAKRLGNINTKIKFELIYYDEPIVDNKPKVIGEVKIDVRFKVLAVTKYLSPEVNMGLKPNYIKEVGKYCDGIKFSTKLKKMKCVTVSNLLEVDKECQDLVAFPNDVQSSLRPWRSNKTCRTIFTRQKRYSPPLDLQYEMQDWEILKKKQGVDYYTSYMRRKEVKSLTSLSGNEDYDVTISKKVLCKDLRIKKPELVMNEKTKKSMYFLPLTPQEMDNIVIFPPVIRTSKIATCNLYNFSVLIKNGNSNPIRLIISTDKEKSIIFTDGNRHVINKHDELTINISYKSGYEGYYVSTLYFIINDSTVLKVPLLAEVVNPSLNISATDIKLDSQRGHQFIEIENFLNIDIPFLWVLLFTNFSIEPITGSVPAGRKILCMVTCSFDIDGPNEIAAKLYSGTFIIDSVDISVAPTRNKVIILKKEVVFGNIPLNEEVMDMVVIKNCEMNRLKFYVNEGEIPPGLSVFPLSGIIDPLGEFNFYVIAKFPNCVIFRFILKINVYRGGVLEIPVHGEVIYPDIEITPTDINIEKIPSSTTKYLNIMIKNNSPVSAIIIFDLNEYEEFSVRKSTNPGSQENLKMIKLDSKSTESLYIFFSPQGASSLTFYLPIVINNLLGPPILHDMLSTKVNYYLTECVGDITQYSWMPNCLPCVKIHTLVTPPKIEVSKHLIRFSTFSMKRNGSTIISVTNPNQKEEEDICIKLEEIKHPLYLEVEENNYKVFNKKVIIFNLKPTEKITFITSFKPGEKEYGEYKALLPIYLRSDGNILSPHNYITIEAKYNRPEIKVTLLQTKDLSSNLDERYIYCFHPLPLCFNWRCFKMLLTCSNHLPDCKLDVSFKSLLHEEFNELIKWEYLENSRCVESNNKYSIILMIYERNMQAKEYRSYFQISCSCGGIWGQRQDGIVENSVLTAYIEIERMFNCSQQDVPYVPSYPLFPETTHPQYDFMNQALSVVQNWINTQVLFAASSYQISDTISFPSFQPPNLVELKRHTKLSCIPLLHVIGNLMGGKVLKPLLSNENYSKINIKLEYLYEIYETVIDLIKNEGATLIHLRPEHLFYYGAFMTYQKNIFNYKEYPLPPSVTMITYDEFIRLSKQSWLDLILQLYKCLYLKRIIEKHSKSVQLNTFKDTPLSNYFSNENIPIQPTLYSESESFILNWLQFHYNSNRNNIWEDKNLNEVSVDLYNNSLCDGLVFGVVLATYCPYLSIFMQDFFLTPENYEQKYHNIGRIIQCLEMINYSFTTKPEEIICGNSIRLLMFSTYLFDILPNMYPVDVMTMKCALSTKKSYKIELENKNEFPVAYKIILISNELKCFSTPINFFEIKPKSKSVLIVTYFAKFATKINSTLILSGECMGYRYVANKCVSLIGIPDITYPTTVITIQQEALQIKHYEFLIQSPYIVKTTYRLQISYDDLKDPDDLLSLLYHENRDQFTCGRFIPKIKCFDFNELGQLTLPAMMSTFTFITINIWLYFRNEDVGDFAVKFFTSVKDTNRREEIIVPIPKDKIYISGRPIQIIMEIPNRNYMFLNAITTICLDSSNEEEGKFWARIIGTPLGFNILGSLYSMGKKNTNLPIPISCKGMLYKVTQKTESDVIMPETIYIEDECTDLKTKVPIILQSRTPSNFSFILESVPLYKKRYYTVTFNYE